MATCLPGSLMLRALGDVDLLPLACKIQVEASIWHISICQRPAGPSDIHPSARAPTWSSWSMYWSKGATHSGEEPPPPAPPTVANAPPSEDVGEPPEGEAALRAWSSSRALRYLCCVIGTGQVKKIRRGPESQRGIESHTVHHNPHLGKTLQGTKAPV